MTIEKTLNTLNKLGNRETFFASDVPLSGGEVTSLKANGYIEATGATRNEVIFIYDDGEKKVVPCKEWRIVRSKIGNVRDLAINLPR